MGETSNKIKAIHAAKKRQQNLAPVINGNAPGDPPSGPPRDGAILSVKEGKIKGKVCRHNLFLCPV